MDCCAVGSLNDNKTTIASDLVKDTMNWDYLWWSSDIMAAVLMHIVEDLD